MAHRVSPNGSDLNAFGVQCRIPRVEKTAVEKSFLVTQIDSVGYSVAYQTQQDRFIGVDLVLKFVFAPYRVRRDQRPIDDGDEAEFDPRVERIDILRFVDGLTDYRIHKSRAATGPFGNVRHRPTDQPGDEDATDVIRI